MWDPRDPGSHRMSLDLGDSGSCMGKLSLDLADLGCCTAIMSRYLEDPLHLGKFCFWFPINLWAA